MKTLKLGTCFVCIFLLIGLSYLSASGGEKADCELALLKCAISLGFTIIGLAMIITLCGAGYAWCLEFLN
jgi:hypothetical protein